MKHELYYRTEYGAWVCNCTRYFDTEGELTKHCKEENEPRR